MNGARGTRGIGLQNQQETPNTERPTPNIERSIHRMRHCCRCKELTTRLSCIRQFTIRHKMKKLTACLGLMIAMTVYVFAQAGNEKNEPLPISQALKLGEEGLTEYTGLSEVGLDRAAEFYAAARRITAEQALGQKDLRLVLDLQSWRQPISDCRRSFYSLAYIVNGGGTMYSHGERRDCSAVEDFLAEFSNDLPLADGKGDPKADTVIDHTIAVIKNLRAPKEQKTELTQAIKRVTESFTNLKPLVDEIPGEQARKIVDFATDPMGWVLSEEDANKFEKSKSVLKSPGK